jgi:hypothetical protein
VPNCQVQICTVADSSMYSARIVLPPPLPVPTLPVRSQTVSPATTVLCRTASYEYSVRRSGRVRYCSSPSQRSLTYS